MVIKHVPALPEKTLKMILTKPADRNVVRYALSLGVLKINILPKAMLSGRIGRRCFRQEFPPLGGTYPLQTAIQDYYRDLLVAKEMDLFDGTGRDTEVMSRSGYLDAIGFTRPFDKVFLLFNSARDSRTHVDSSSWLQTADAVSMVRMRIVSQCGEADCGQGCILRVRLPLNKQADWKSDRIIVDELCAGLT